MPSGDPMDSHQDMTGEARWLTYGQLASVRRISRGSAVRLARRMKWARQAGNDGFARVLVPVAWQEPAGDRTRDNPDDATEEGPRDSDASVAFQAALIAVREAHAGEVAALQTRANIAESFASELRSRLDEQAAAAAELRRELEAAKAGVEQVEQGRETAEARADELRTRLDELEAQLAARQEAVDAAEALRQAEAARTGQGRWARLRAAWRGE
jgi:septal ring factor EnvC (AmiA/AmiB activator)